MDRNEHARRFETGSEWRPPISEFCPFRNDGLWYEKHWYGTTPVRRRRPSRRMLAVIGCGLIFGAGLGYGHGMLWHFGPRLVHAAGAVK